MRFFFASRARHASATEFVSRLAALVLALVAAPLFATRSLAAEPSPAAPPLRGVLHLNNGGTVSGDLADSLDPDVLRWQSPLFTSPFDFRLKGIDAIYFALPATLPKPVGDYCFELAGGDILFGSLLELDKETVLLDVPQAGRFHVRRDAMRRFSRWKDGAGLVYRGPSGLDEWNAAPPSAWHNEHGQLSTDQPRASLEGKFALPPRGENRIRHFVEGQPRFCPPVGSRPR